MIDPLDWKKIFQAYQDGLMVTDRELAIQYVNGAFARLVGVVSQKTVRLQDKTVAGAAGGVKRYEFIEQNGKCLE